MLPFLKGAHGHPDAFCDARVTIFAASAAGEDEAK